MNRPNSLDWFNAIVSAIVLLLCLAGIWLHMAEIIMRLGL